MKPLSYEFFTYLINEELLLLPTIFSQKYHEGSYTVVTEEQKKEIVEKYGETFPWDKALFGIQELNELNDTYRGYKIKKEGYIIPNILGKDLTLFKEVKNKSIVEESLLKWNEEFHQLKNVSAYDRSMEYKITERLEALSLNMFKEYYILRIEHFKLEDEDLWKMFKGWVHSKDMNRHVNKLLNLILPSVENKNDLSIIHKSLPEGFSTSLADNVRYKLWLKFLAQYCKDEELELSPEILKERYNSTTGELIQLDILGALKKYKFELVKDFILEKHKQKNTIKIAEYIEKWLVEKGEINLNQELCLEENTNITYTKTLVFNMSLLRKKAEKNKKLMENVLTLLRKNFTNYDPRVKVDLEDNLKISLSTENKEDFVKFIPYSKDALNYLMNICLNKTKDDLFMQKIVGSDFWRQIDELAQILDEEVRKYIFKEKMEKTLSDDTNSKSIRKNKI